MLFKTLNYAVSFRPSNVLTFSKDESGVYICNILMIFSWLKWRSMRTSR